MYKKSLLSICLVVLLSAVACSATPPATDAPFTPTPLATQTPAATPTAAPSPGAPAHLTILYTNDEHGWMEATKETGGAAGLMGLWRDQEGYVQNGAYLILSGGDMWTGPAISTWFNGRSMVEVMNAMGYVAAAVGNHEFDFGLDELRARAAQMDFPLLAANLRARDGGAASIVADGAVKPYIVTEVGGIRVGVIGLASLKTPMTTMPSHVADFEFVPYQEALAAVVPQVKADGGDLLIVLGHICGDEMTALAPAASQLGIAVIGGGHCHRRVSRVVDGVALIESGAYMQAYVRVDLDWDSTTSTVVDIQAQVHDNQGGAPDRAVAEVVARWRAQTDDALSEVVGYARRKIPRRSNAMFNMVTDAWLAAYPAADVALANRGGFRQDIPAGEITLSTIVGVLPFNNVLIDVELTGAQLIENIECCSPVVGGMTTIGGYALADGTPIDREATYHVLVNDFMYAGGDDFRFQAHDPDAYNTAIDWRQPVIDWLRSLETSPDDPLDDHLDVAARQK